MFDAMRDPELMRMAQEQMSRMSPADFARIQQQMMSNPDLLRMATESMQNMRPEDIKMAAEQLKHTRPDQMAEIGGKMANASAEELASMRAHLDAQMSYEISAAEMLKKQGNDLHSQGKYRSALEKYIRAKQNLKDVSASKGRNLLLACSLNIMSCYLKTNQFEECINEGIEVLAYDPSNLKALYRRGQAYKELGKLEDALSDLTKALEVSPGDETIAEVLRDAEERLVKQGGERRSRGLIIEEITDESATSSEIQMNSTSENSELQSEVTSRGNNSSETKPTSSENMETLKADTESARSFPDFVFRSTDREKLSPDMLKTASSVIGKMSPEELRRMAEVASSSSPGFGPRSDIPTGMLKTASDVMAKMSPEDIQKMFEMASSLKGNNQASSSPSIPTNVSPDMIKMANDMMTKMSDEDRRKMFEFASSSLRGGNGAAESSTRDSIGLRLDENKNGGGVSSVQDSGDMNGGEPSFPSSSVDLQDQMRKQMKDPAMRQMLTSMMKSMSPDMMSNMSEQFGFKLSREEAEKAQQAMSSLSPDALDTMMKWADRVQRCVEGARKTKNWLLGKPGMVLAICMLLLAVILHSFGFIGK